MTETPPEQPTPAPVAVAGTGPDADQLLPDAPDQADDNDVDDLDGVKLNPGVTRDRATGLVAVYDTRELRFVTGTMSPDDQRLDGLSVKVTKTGRYQLRAV